MRKISKNTPPKLLTTYKKQIGASYDDIDKNVYDATLLALLNEQGWVCGYCQQKIAVPQNATIEHYCEKSICNGTGGTADLTLDYTNMMAVCLGKTTNDTHCDEKKSKFRLATGLPIEISPWNTAHIKAISYTSTGTIKSSNTRHNTEIDKILNLNISYLKKNRKSKFVSLLKAAGNISVKKGKDRLKKILNDELVIGNNRYPSSFPGMCEYMMKYTK
ncbi:hypothetical protein [Flavobacterium tructae]|uniref:hypothetical protein n=1 Tax=Flavobacterium tructae TaxID=1114873 RepID=UPI0035A95DC5